MINPRKQARRDQQVAKRNTDMAGDGNYVFQNNTNGEFYLPRPTKQNVRKVGRDQQFVGDSYYFGLVKTGELKLVKEVHDHKETDQLFVYRNRTRDDVHLPVPNSLGQTVVGPNKEFVGGCDYFPLLKTGQLVLVKEVTEMDDKKLITEQPPTVTDEGQVEFVKRDGKLTEIEKKEQEKKFNENTLDDVRLLLD